MGFSFRNLFNDNADGMTGDTGQGGGSLPPANGGGDQNALPPQAAPGGGVSPIPTNESIPFDSQPTGRGGREEKFAAGNRVAMEASGAASMSFGAAPAVQAGTRAVYTIGDLLQFVPPALATRDAVSPEQRVEVELPVDGSRDVKLSTLYRACPQLFATEITPLNDSQLTLPNVMKAGAPAAAASPFGTPSISHQPQPQLQAPVDPTVQTGVSASVPAVNPFDPNLVQHSSAAAALPPSAGASPQQASMPPMSGHQSEPVGSAGSAQVPAPSPFAQAGAPSSVGINPFAPKLASPAPAPQPAPMPQSASGPVPIPKDTTEVAPERVNIRDAKRFSSAGDGSGGAAEAPDEMPSPFSPQKDNPFFLADDAADADLGATTMPTAGVATNEPNSFDPAAVAPLASPAAPEISAPQAFEQPQQQPQAARETISTPAMPVQHTAPAPAQVQSSVFAQLSAGSRSAAPPSNPFAQMSASPTPSLASEPETTPVPTPPESFQSDAPTEVPSVPASTMSNVEAPVAAASSQSFVPMARPTQPQTEATTAFEPEASERDVATPPPLQSSSPSDAAASTTPMAEKPEFQAQAGPAESVPASSAQKSSFGGVAEKVAPAPTPMSKETIALPLIELLGGRSAQSLGFSPQSLPDGAKADLPLSRIENQLSTGRVTVTLGDLAAAAADQQHGTILAQGNQSVEIHISQNLLFHHLPDVAPTVEPVVGAQQEAPAESVNPLPPVQATSVAANEAFAPAPADPVGCDSPPSDASVGFATPFSSFAKDDEFLAGPSRTASEASAMENKSQSVEDSVEANCAAESDDSAPAVVDWMKSIPGPLKGFGSASSVANDTIETEQPCHSLEEDSLVESPSKPAGSGELLGKSKQSETPIKKAASADQFAIDAESDDEVVSFFTPSRPDSDEVGVPSKRAVADIDSLDTLPVLDEDETEIDLGGGFFDELPSPAFSFEDDLPRPVDDKSEQAVAKQDAATDDVVGDASVEVEDRSEVEQPIDDAVISNAATSSQLGAVPRGSVDRVRDIELRAIFGTTEEFTLQRIADLTLQLCSGIDSCDVLARGRAVSASRRSGTAEQTEAASRDQRAKTMYRTVRDLADHAGLAQAEELTLHTESHAISFFTHGSACVTIHHERDEFRSGLREKLILVSRGLAVLES